MIISKPKKEESGDGLEHFLACLGILFGMILVSLVLFWLSGLGEYSFTNSDQEDYIPTGYDKDQDVAVNRLKSQIACLEGDGEFMEQNSFHGISMGFSSRVSPELQAELNRKEAERLKNARYEDQCHKDGKKYDTYEYGKWSVDNVEYLK